MKCQTNSECENINWPFIFGKWRFDWAEITLALQRMKHVDEIPDDKLSQSETENCEYLNETKRGILPNEQNTDSVRLFSTNRYHHCIDTAPNESESDVIQCAFDHISSIDLQNIECLENVVLKSKHRIEWHSTWFNCDKNSIWLNKKKDLRNSMVDCEVLGTWMHWVNEYGGIVAHRMCTHAEPMPIYRFRTERYSGIR